MFSMRFRRLVIWIALSWTAVATSNAWAAASDCERYLTEAQILSHDIGSSGEDLRRLFSYYQEEARNWRAFLKGDSFDGQRVHIIHQTGIKDLNERLWNMTGGEEYLETLHELLHGYLKTNPALGSVLHNDYKNHFVVSPLDAPSFRDIVLKPVMERLILAMRAKRPDIDWAAWIPAVLYHGEGKTPADAFFGIGLARARFSQYPSSMTVAEYQAQATARRARLLKYANDHKLEWEELLIQLHKNIGRSTDNEAGLRAWLAERGADASIVGELRRYCDDLQIGDFHPLPDARPAFSLARYLKSKADDPIKTRRTTWAVERRVIFTAMEDAHYVAATDVMGMGGIARILQDRWIARGARLEELDSVYTQSTAALEMFFGNIFRQLQRIAAPGKVKVYWSGDDALWFFPKLTARQKQDVRRQLQSLSSVSGAAGMIALKLHYSKLTPVDRAKDSHEGIAEALIRARESLFAGKRQ